MRSPVRKRSKDRGKSVDEEKSKGDRTLWIFKFYEPNVSLIFDTSDHIIMHSELEPVMTVSKKGRFLF